MRTLAVRLHRWFGLFTALFLAVAGLSGAIIAWDHELDAWLNPRFHHAASGPGAQPLSSLDLAARLEFQDPRIRVTYVPLAPVPGRTLVFGVVPARDPATGRDHPLAFDQVAVDPATGAIQGRRLWGRASLRRQDLLPFIYRLHYSLHLPAAGGLEPGILFMGFVGLVWVLDCFLALGISFPDPRQWRRSLAFRWNQGAHKRTFDLHRSGGVWVWALLLVAAITSVSMNLGPQVVRPLVARLSTLAPLAGEMRGPRSPAGTPAPALGREEILLLARAAARGRGWSAPAGGMYYSPAQDLYGVGFFSPGRDHGDGGLGNPWLSFDGRTGSPAGETVPGRGSAGDLFLQAQFPLHSGRILGLPGRILVTALGLGVAVLSMTGLLLWMRRLGNRRRALAGVNPPG